MQILLITFNRVSKLFGNITKVFISYPFHFFLPNKRFTIPTYSKAIIRGKKQKIQKNIWQTNYTNKVSLPIYLNYLFNRLMSLDYDYHYVSTEDRLKFIRENSSKKVLESYKRLNDGAAQADLWRLLTLYKYGGIYLDIDAHLVFPLFGIIKSTDNELFIKKDSGSSHTNYFIAAKQRHVVIDSAVDTIIKNIQSNKLLGVFSLTGPVPFSQAIDQNMTKINSKFFRYVCIQGSFTNEYFQYIDKPNGKWTHKNPEDVLKQKK